MSPIDMLRVDPVHTFCHHTMSNKSIFCDTTVSSGIIKKRKMKESKKKNALLDVVCVCVSYTVLFLTHNILRLSAMSQMGHKPMFWKPALPPSSGSMLYETPSH